MPSVLNLRDFPDGIPENSVVVDRSSKWGNPYRIPRNLSKNAATRRAAIDNYRRYLLQSPELLAALSELRGKNLMCWCSPKPCHGDVLLELANKELAP